MTAHGHGITFSPTTTHGGAPSGGGLRRWVPIAVLLVGASAIGAFALVRGHAPPGAPTEPAAPASAVALPPPPASASPPEFAPTVLPPATATLGPTATPVPETVRAPPRVDRSPPRTAPAAPSAPASAGPDCHVVSYFDANGNKHFKKECR